MTAMMKGCCILIRWMLGRNSMSAKDQKIEANVN